jgi:hypothetical protein
MGTCLGDECLLRHSSTLDLTVRGKCLMYGLRPAGTLIAMSMLSDISVGHLWWHRTRRRRWGDDDAAG